MIAQLRLSGGECSPDLYPTQDNQHQVQHLWAQRLLQGLTQSAGLQLIACSALHTSKHRLIQLIRHRRAQPGHQAAHTRAGKLRVPCCGPGTWNKQPWQLPASRVRTRETTVAAGHAAQGGKLTVLPHRSRTSESRACQRWRWRSRPLKELEPNSLWRFPSRELRRFMSLFTSSSRREHGWRTRRGDRDLRNHGHPGVFK